jgi:2-C-methyl-D-erythritol 4-phosphate cytidylyltransferase
VKPVSRISLVIPAAGSGTRFGGPIPKQLLPLKGRAVFLRSLDAFAGHVSEAVIAVSDDLRADIETLLINAGLPFPVRLTTGGATRQASVYAGLLASDPTSDAILVHDAVRPLVPASCIAACIAALRDHVAAVVAVPCAATVKRARSDGTVDTTVARDDLWLAQTPQGLRRAEALAAFARAVAENWSCSDDAQVMERAGHRVALVLGDARNLKLTTPDDWAVAEALLGKAGTVGTALGQNDV